MRTRHVTTAVTMLALCGVLVFAVLWGWNALVAGVDDPEAAPSAGPTCDRRTFEKGQKLRARQVQVSVYNAGDQAGAADSTLAALTKRGFRAGEVGNAPSDVSVRRVQVWTTADVDVRARLVAKQLGKKTRVRYGIDSLGPGIDIVIGDRFNGVVKAKPFIKVTDDQEICLPARNRGSGTDTNAAGR